jgi:O-antigen/teichoic acid export membrane protein
MTKFFKFSFLSVVDTFIKLMFAVILVYIGLSTIGGFAGIGVGLLVGLVISWGFLKGNVKGNFSLKSDFKEKKVLLNFAIPTFITTLALTSFFTTDIILVRYFFGAVESGLYSSLSVLGKIIYFASSPVTLVVFPLASEYYAKKLNYQKIFIQGLCVVLIICSIITAAYFVVPDLMMSALFGNDYSAITPLMGPFAVFISIYTVCALFANFYLSIHKTAVSYIVSLAAVLQITLICFFHKDLLEIIWVSILSCVVLLISLLLYYPHAKGR